MSEVKPIGEVIVMPYLRSSGSSGYTLSVEVSGITRLPGDSNPIYNQLSPDFFRDLEQLWKGQMNGN